MTIDENTKFVYNDTNTGLTMLDFWKFQYSMIFDLQDEIAEFIVAKALEQDKAYNKELWTLHDITYQGIRIEVKETSYYHAWQTDEEPKSSVRSFSIRKTNSHYEHPYEENRYERQNDIYVFCLNTGLTKAESYPLDLNNWEFYIIPTSVINEKCNNNKTISLLKIKKLGYQAKCFDEIKAEIDRIVQDIEENR